MDSANNDKEENRGKIYSEDEEKEEGGGGLRGEVGVWMLRWRGESRGGGGIGGAVEMRDTMGIAQTFRDGDGQQTIVAAYMRNNSYIGDGDTGR